MQAARQRYWRDSTLPFLELRTTFDSLQNYKPHFHSELSFGALTSGTTRAQLGAQEFILEQGDLIIIPPYLVHACNARDGQSRSYHMLYLNADWCVEHVPAFGRRSIPPTLDRVVIVRSPSLFARYLKLIADLANASAREIASQTQLLMNDVLNDYDGASDARSSSLLAQRIRQALLDDVEKPPTLDELARNFGCRKETLIRVFRRQYHTTPHAFLNSARVERAKQRLKTGEKIAHVAADLGFCDQAQLHRTFVQYTASTPGQYFGARQSARVNIRQ